MIGWRRRRRAVIGGSPPDLAAAAFSPPFLALLRKVLYLARRPTGAPDRAGPARRRVRSRGGAFAGHRPYHRGDEARTVDWHVYARTGELHTKVLEDEERRTLTLIVDASASMDAGLPARRIAALRLAAIEGSLALLRLDALQLVADARGPVVLRGAAAQPRLLDALVRAGRSYSPVTMLQRPLADGWRGRFLWLSDFADLDEVEPALRLLQRFGRSCIGVVPAIADDLQPALDDGLCSVRDPETGATLNLRVDAELCAAVATELRRLARLQDALFSRCGHALWRFPVPAVDDFSIGAWRRRWADG